jgi:hypothetical protein
MSERADGTPGATEQGGGATAYTVPSEGPAPQEAPAASTAPEYASGPVAFRRPDVVAALLLVLAGVAAGISLLLNWLADRDDSGMELVRRGFDEMGNLGSTGFWQPLVIVLGGGVLFVLGLLMFLPARTHRLLGVLALAVTALAAAGVLVPVAQNGWRLTGFAVGFWFAIAVPVLGLLGSLKALLTRERASRP